MAEPYASSDWFSTGFQPPSHPTLLFSFQHGLLSASEPSSGETKIEKTCGLFLNNHRDIYMTCNWWSSYWSFKSENKIHNIRLQLISCFTVTFLMLHSLFPVYFLKSLITPREPYDTEGNSKMLNENDIYQLMVHIEKTSFKSTIISSLFALSFPPVLSTGLIFVHTHKNVCVHITRVLIF